MTLSALARRCCLLGAFVLLFGPGAARAHDARPAYLEITETTPVRYDVLWRTPLASGARLPVLLKLPDEAREVAAQGERVFPDSILVRRMVDVPGGLGGKRVEFTGLQGTITDVLARVQWLDGSSSTTLIRPSKPWLEIAAAPGRWTTAWSFLVQGVRHIAFGVDHLLFVFALLLLGRTPMKVIKTVTAFTVAHSITLALAVLGLVRLAPIPVEALIALSILFLGPEIIKAGRGQSTFTIRHQWVVAFVFGLLHGFGFAGGLLEIGLPQNDIALALLMFNLGVEAGQLAFVALMLAAMTLLKTTRIDWPAWARLLPAYVVGSMGAFWVAQRVALMF